MRETSGSGTLHVVATPIGNLGDLSPRAAKVLAGVDLIACEDTRRTGKLLHLAGIPSPGLMRVDMHTEEARTARVLEVLGAGGDVALVSDAGTPAVSDPGRRLVTAVSGAGHRVATVPGPSAVTAALAASGLVADRFVFEGFLPRKGAERGRRLASLAAESRTVVLFESPNRIGATLRDLVAVCGGARPAVVARELTKVHETIHRGDLADLCEEFSGGTRGEIVLVISGAPPPGPVDDDEVRGMLSGFREGGMDRRTAVLRTTAETGAGRNRVYELSLELDWS